MSCFTEYREIESILRDVQKVEWKIVFELYYPSECNKRNSEERDEWLKRTENTFAARKWKIGQARIGDLFPLNMYSVGWIRKFACSRTNCQHYLINDDCINCCDHKLTRFTLGDVVRNYGLPEKGFSRFIKNKIVPIQNEINLGNMNDKMYIIIENSNPPFVMDGNSRLISMATMLDKLNEYITCFIWYSTSADNIT